MVFWVLQICAFLLNSILLFVLYNLLFTKAISCHIILLYLDKLLQLLVKGTVCIFAYLYITNNSWWFYTNSDGIKYHILLINRNSWHYLQHLSILHKKQLLNHTLNKFVLNLYSVLETITGTRNTVVNKTELPAFLELTLYFEKRDNKQTNKNKLYSMSTGHRVI